MKHAISTVLLACACSLPAWAAPDWTRARIVKLEPDKARVTLKHQRIHSIGMAAMTMPFKVADGLSLAPFKVGDTVRFTVTERNDHLVIDAMEPTR